MAKPNWLVAALRSVGRFVFSAKFVPVLKGTLGYTLALSLIMIRGFEDLTPFPLALSSMLIIVIAGNTGGPIGATLQATFLAATGIAIGGLFFFILAKLHTSHVAQGFVFFFFVYGAALIKAQGNKWFGFSLLAVLMAFSGIYTSVLLNAYSAAYLQSYLEAYAWGIAIGMGVNLLVWPRSSEKELRQMLVLSLDHIGTFAHLLSKTYTMTITEDEKKVRDHLAQSLRADFGFLSQKLSDTACEINFSKYSMQDYAHFIARTRVLQVSSISAYSSLVGVEDNDVALFKSHFLANTKESFLVFRRSVDITLKEIKAALQCQPLSAVKLEPGYTDYMDVEAQAGEISEPLVEPDTAGDGINTAQISQVERDVDLQLRLVAQRLQTEVAGTDDSSTVRDTVARSTAPSSRPTTAQQNQEKPEKAPRTKEADNTPHKSGVERIAATFDKFALVQQHILSEILATGAMHGHDQELRMHLPQPSMGATWGDSPTVDAAFGRDDAERSPDERAEDAETRAHHHSLLRVYSFIFAMRIYVQQLELYHRDAIRFQPGKPGKHAARRMQLHFFQSLHRPREKAWAAVTAPKFARTESEDITEADGEPDLGFKEAMALLENRPYIRKPKTIWQRLKVFEDALRSPVSIFAFKTAAGAMVFTMLLLAETTRQFFIDYALTGGVLTLIVSIAPTLGQSLMTFILQIMGSGLGSLWAVALLEIFRGVGGYTFNPYGVVAVLSFSSLPFFYLIYYNPKFFVLALLALNSAGVLIVAEWINVEYYHRPFDSPILRAGKAFTALGIALGIAVTFQMFILRNPARRTLRKSLAALTFSMLSYYTLFQAYVMAVVPVNLDDHRPPKAAINRVRKELMHRELKLQQQIIELGPLLAFAKAEVDFITPFRADLAARIMRSHQIILDRIREARISAGTEPVPEVLTREFSARLYPYRRRGIRLAKASLFTCASSLASKSPLPRETPARLFLRDNLSDLLHDAMVISSHISRTEEGKETVLNGELTRYWAYVMTITSTSEQFIALEDTCHEMFGDLDSTLD